MLLLKMPVEVGQGTEAGFFRDLGDAQVAAQQLFRNLRPEIVQKSHRRRAVLLSESLREPAAAESTLRREIIHRQRIAV